MPAGTHLSSPFTPPPKQPPTHPSSGCTSRRRRRGRRPNRDVHQTCAQSWQSSCQQPLVPVAFLYPCLNLVEWGSFELVSSKPVEWRNVCPTAFQGNTNSICGLASDEGSTVRRPVTVLTNEFLVPVQGTVILSLGKPG